MKHILNSVILLFTCLMVMSCTTNYYSVLLSEDIKMYSSKDSTHILTTIPKDTPIYLSSKLNKNNYKKIKWKNYSGWAFKPNYTTYSSYIPVNTTSNTPSYNYNSSSSSFGGSVHVKGYHRKDGTYVKPHCRSSPSRRR